MEPEQIITETLNQKKQKQQENIEKLDNKIGIELENVTVKKQRKRILKNIFNIESFKIVIPCAIAFAGFLFQSRWVKKLIVKRYLTKPKKFHFQMVTKLGYIKRSNVFRSWDKLVNDEEGVKPFILVEGYQGSGKSFLAKKYIAEHSKIRPAIYISLREVQLENWEKMLARQINFNYKIFPDSKGLI